jgi:hypothetical protein
MSAAAVQTVVDLGGEEILSLLDRTEQRMNELAAGHGELLARFAGQTIAAGGKRLRPLLVFLAAGAPPPDTDGLLRAAVAVELVHGATLIHDDVLDGSSPAPSPSWRRPVRPRRCGCSRGPAASWRPARSCSAPTPSPPT